MAGIRIPNSPLSSDMTCTKLDQERLLPIANVSRIMKKSLPSNAKISKEAKETVQECVSEFISFITGEASDKCQREKRKTINGDDLLWAMTTLGFQNYVAPLKEYLGSYRETEGDEKNVVVMARNEDDYFSSSSSSSSSSSTSPPLSSNVDADKITANPASFMQAFRGGDYRRHHGGVVIEFGKFEGKGGRAIYMAETRVIN